MVIVTEEKLACMIGIDDKIFEKMSNVDKKKAIDNVQKCKSNARLINKYTKILEENKLDIIKIDESGDSDMLSDDEYDKIVNEIQFIMMGSGEISTKRNKIQKILNSYETPIDLDLLLEDNDEYQRLTSDTKLAIHKITNETLEKIAEYNNKILSIETEKNEKISGFMKVFDNEKNKLLEKLKKEDIPTGKTLLEFVNTSPFAKLYGLKFEISLPKISKKLITRQVDDRDPDAGKRRLNTGKIAEGTDSGMPPNMARLKMNKTHFLRAFMILRGGWSEEDLFKATKASTGRGGMTARLAGNMANNPNIALIKQEVIIDSNDVEKVSARWNPENGNVTRTKKGDIVLQRWNTFMEFDGNGYPRVIGKCKHIYPTEKEATESNRIWAYPSKGSDRGIFARPNTFTNEQVLNWELPQEEINIAKLNKDRRNHMECSEESWIEEQFDKDQYMDEKLISTELKTAGYVIPPKFKWN